MNTGNGEDTRDYWDAESARFDDAPDHGLRDPAVHEAWRSLLLGVFPEPPARVADLGCGTGTLSRLLADEGYPVDGLDLSPDMIARARTKCPDLWFTVGDASHPPLEKATYDVVLGRHVLWALPDPEGAIERWVALLRPGGRLVLAEGHWSTGAGLTATQCERILRTQRREVSVTRLDDPAFWGRPIIDERYLMVSCS